MHDKSSAEGSGHHSWIGRVLRIGQARPEPYWTVISAGCAVGYRRGAKGGTSIARLREGTTQHDEALGAADGHRDADGLGVLSFPQAQEQARA